MFSRDVGNHRSFPAWFETMKSIQELSTPALLVDSAQRNISLEDSGKSATISAQQSIIKSHRRSEPIELLGLLATLT